MYLILCCSYLNHSLRFVGGKKRKKKSHIKSQSQYFGKKSQLDYFPKSFSPTVWVCLSVHGYLSVLVSVCGLVYMCVCVCECVCVCLYICVCVCVCVCERAAGPEREIWALRDRRGDWRELCLEPSRQGLRAARHSSSLLSLPGDDVTIQAFSVSQRFIYMI